MKLKYLFNPFERITSRQALFIGLTVIALTIVFISTIHRSEKNIEAIDSLTIQQKTENVVKALEKGKFNAITVYFDDAMKKALPANKLRKVWSQVIVTCGKFERADISYLEIADIAQYSVLDVPLFFQKEERRLRLTFDDKGKICGLFIQ